jgi:shikimate 5-dehydrogenase
VAQIRQDRLSRGALITSHKLDLLAAARELFDELDRYAELCGEISCISKRDGQVRGRAFDPVTVGTALERLAGRGYWREREADVLCLGAGGAGVALATYLADRRPAGDRPRRLLLVDVNRERLRSLAGLVERLDPAGMAVELVHNREAAANERLLAALPPGSLVVNATGMGKDIPGSPLPEEAVFPRQGIVWELNYRGARPFYRRALAQAEVQELAVADGWDYFLIGWAQIVGEVFEVEIGEEAFARMAAVAEEIR